MDDIGDNITPLFNTMGLPGNCDVNRQLFDRAVLRPPPRLFSIEFLPPTYKGSYNHGMRIAPVSRKGDLITSRGWDYDIWRKWEDILWFQEALESQYRRAAREKRVRLAQGKGVKSLNGMYKQDMASSWESLPPGPPPSSVAQDIHEYLPRMSKKGTVFRASRPTVDRRQEQFRSLVETLFSNNMPSLIMELRVTHHISDFFALWRRDFDLLEIENKFHPLTSSITSSYFSESSPVLASSNDSKRSSSTSRRSDRPRSTGSSIAVSLTQSSQVSTDNLSVSASTKSTVKRLSSSSDEGAPIPEVTRPRALSITSSDSASTHSDGCSEKESTIEATPTIVGDAPITFNHNPQVLVERCSSILEVLPEEREMLAKSESSETCFEFPTPTFPKSTSSPADRKTNRSWQVVSMPTTNTTPKEGKHIVRESYQSCTSVDSSADSFLDGIHFSLSSIKEQDYRASIYTVMTTNSTDTVHPRDSVDDELKRASNTVSLSEFGIFDAEAGEEDSTQNVVPFPSQASSADLPQTPALRLTVDFPTTPTNAGNHGSSSFECQPSPADSNAPTSPFTPSPTSSNLLSIKAAHNSSIIMLRVSKDTSFDDIRQRLYNKFVGQEGIPLSKEFAVAMVVPTTTISDLSPAKSSSSSQKSSTLSVSSIDKMELHFIDSQHDWEEIVLIRESNKVTLRILDAPGE